MSVFTTEVRFICEVEAGLKTSQGQMRVKDIIKAARPKIFDFDYPIFDVEYKPHLEEKILRHFYTREICVETYGLWKLRLEDKLNEIMPYYNQLYLSEQLKFEPLFSDNYTREGNQVDINNRNDIEGIKTKTDNTRDIETAYEEKSKTETDSTENTTTTESVTGQTSETKKGKGSNDSTTTGSRKTDTTTKQTTQNTQTNAFSDTPQSGLTDVAKLNYLTDYRVINDNGNSSGETHTTNSDTSETKGTSSNDVTTSGNSSEQSQGTENVTGNSVTDGSKDATTTTKDGFTEATGSDRNLNSTENLHKDYFETITGYRGISASRLLQEFRETFLNIDQEILKELESLFFGLWA